MRYSKIPQFSSQAKDISYTQTSTDSSPSENSSDYSQSIEKPSKTIAHKHKTELCKTYSELGYCRYGHKCRFAHGYHELKIVATVNQNYRKRKCKGYWQNNECKYGIRCQFEHQRTDWSDRLILGLQRILVLKQKDNQQSRLLRLLDNK